MSEPRSYRGSLPAAVRTYSDAFLRRQYDQYRVFEGEVKTRDAVYADILREEIERRERRA